LDSTFQGSAAGAGVPVPEVSHLALQADLKILVSGYFRTLSGQACTNFGRLETDGRFDTNFNATSDSDVNSIALQTDGKIILGGLFSTLNGQPRANLGRLNADATLDPTFTTGIDTNPIAISPTALIGPNVLSVVVDHNGAVLVGGWFIAIGGVWRTNLARLQNTETATESLAFNGSAISWLRGGASPEVWHTTFAACTNGQDWYELGAGTRITGGWQLSGVTLPSKVAVRACGFVQGGSLQGASWVVETVIGEAVITAQPLDQTNNAGTVATFYVSAGGTGPLSYWWNKNGKNLADGAGVYGTGTSTLTLSNVLHTDAGAYSVIVSNSFGAVTSRVATLKVIDPFITMQPVSQVVNEGGSAAFAVGAIGTVPLSYQWLRNGQILPGATADTLVVTSLQRTDTSAAYQAIVTNLWGSSTSATAVLTVNLALPDALNPAPDSEVDALAVQPDGKIVVGGYFSSLAGVPRNLIARLNSDGSLDSAFNPGTNFTGNAVHAVALQVDGSILVGGDYRTSDGQAGLIRILPDGTRDTGFRSGLGGIVTSINALAVQNDGKVLAGGFFSTIGGQLHTNLARLNPDGRVDDAFKPSLSSGVLCLAVQTNGGIVVGGFAGTINGEVKTGIGRLNPDGTLDGSFGAFTEPGDSATVAAVATQADGKILIGGFFQILDGFSLRDTGRIGRLNSDGTVDTSFNPGANGPVESLAVEADGRILVLGEFTLLGGEPRTAIGRLNADGSLDPSFDLSLADGSYRSSLGCAIVEPSGATLVGGYFDTIAGEPRQGLARVNSTDPVASSLSFDGSTITWLRSGPAPEFVWAAFQASTNGSDWFSLGTGQRVAAGWQLAQVVLPTNAVIRARGTVEVGLQGCSTWFVEDTTTVDPSIAPLIIVNDGGFGLASGRFAFNVAGLIGQTIVVQSSSDFLSWTGLATNLIETGRFHFSELTGANQPLRFYRARLQ
jgi:uncharacterized delta-60 repeat protein